MIATKDKTKKHEKFSQQGVDILSYGHTETKEPALAYNGQLTRYNSLYANLVSQYHVNTQLIADILDSNPGSESMEKVAHEVY